MPGSSQPVRTTCPYCGVGCGVLASADGQDGAGIKGDPDHPANFGRLCSKGSALGETVNLDGRLLSPVVAGRATTWDHALDVVADGFRDAIERHGPDSVAFYVSGQLLTEDYYVANKLMKGFIGSANIDTNSRLCMASTVAGHRRAFGEDVVPGTYEDLEQADLIVLVGSNLAWCHPVLFQRIAAARARRPDMRIVAIDPRRTATCDEADLHLALRPGTDVAVFNGLLHRIDADGAINWSYVFPNTDGLSEALQAAGDATTCQVAAEASLAHSDLEQFYDLWIRTERVVTIFSQGVNQSSSGTDKVNAIINCHLATGRIGRPGMGPFSVTGQPNAMGGREVGGLSNTLACHLDIENAEHREAVQGFWNGPSVCETPGLKAVDLFQACADGRIKALWIMSTNPVVSMPDADAVRAAIQACPFVVVSDIQARTDTNGVADVLLPAAAWGEKSGTVTNSDRTISRQRAFLTSPAGVRPDWRIIADVAARMGWQQHFQYAGPADIFREHARLSGIAGRVGRMFDISGLSDISDADYDNLEPVRWPVVPGKPPSDRLFAKGAFPTADGRGRFVAVQPRAPARDTDADWPLRLNTGRVRDHWHTMTRTAKSPRLSQHFAEPFVELHPADAERWEIQPADLVRVETPSAHVIVRALVTDRTMPGVIFVPMHWTSQWTSTGRIGAAVAAAVDPISGQPELKGGVARIAPYRPAWYGFAAARGAMTPGTAYWAVARTAFGWRAELADSDFPSDWEAMARSLFDVNEGSVAVVTDSARGVTRIALEGDEGPEGVLFTATEPVEVARAHVLALLEGTERLPTLLVGRPGTSQVDPGAIVCSCFGVGTNTILKAISDQGLSDIDAIGQCLQAGTNCGSCRPELGALLASVRPSVAA